MSTFTNEQLLNKIVYLVDQQEQLVAEFNKRGALLTQYEEALKERDEIIAAFKAQAAAASQPDSPKLQEVTPEASA